MPTRHTTCTQTKERKGRGVGQSGARRRGRGLLCNHQHEGGDAVRVRRDELQVSVFERDDALQQKARVKRGRINVTTSSSH